MKITQGKLKQIIKEELNKLQEGDPTSRAISRLEDIGNIVKEVIQVSSDPEAVERLERADQLITELWEQMHDMLDGPSNQVAMQQQDQV
jgi:hypothetical protein